MESDKMSDWLPFAFAIMVIVLCVSLIFGISIAALTGPFKVLKKFPEDRAAYNYKCDGYEWLPVAYDTMKNGERHYKVYLTYSSETPQIYGGEDVHGPAFLTRDSAEQYCRIENAKIERERIKRGYQAGLVYPSTKTIQEFDLRQRWYVAERWTIVMGEYKSTGLN